MENVRETIVLEILSFSFTIIYAILLLLLRTSKKQDIFVS